MLTIKEVAQAANVSVATVSRVLNHDKRVALKTKEHVLRVVKELDYTPNTLGRNLRVSATKKILVLLPSVLNQFFSSVMQGIEESVQARGYQVMMSTTRSDPQIEQSYIEFLYNKSIDGIIFFNSEQTPEAIDRLSKKYPITFCISSLEGAKASAVTIDNVRAAYDAVSSLIQAGHRKIALVYEPEASHGKLRGQGYKRALAQFGLPIRPEYLQPCDSSFDSGAEACGRLMALSDPPTAIFAISDVIAAGVVQRLGLRRINTFSGCPGSDPDAHYPNWVTCPWPEDFQEVLDYQWNQVLIPYWRETAAFAAEHGVTQIALEMHPGFCVYHTESLLRLRRAVGEQIGANLDPSHLIWQGMDPIAVIRALKGAIFHFHAKDTKIDPYNTAVNGVLDTKPYREQETRSWNFRSVGYGNGPLYWKDMISNLRLAGYDHVISVEHEDGLMSRSEGLAKACGFLKDIIIQEKVGMTQ